MGASVVVADMNPCPIENAALKFQKTDVTSWEQLTSLFKLAHDSHGRIDHVFANAGISPRMHFIEDRVDETGNLVEPDWQVIDINFKAVVSTVYLALHYLRKQESGGSIVITASASSYQRYSGGDYSKLNHTFVINGVFADFDSAAAKHGVLGLMRSIVPNLQRTKSPIRINAIAPSYTITGIVPEVAKDIIGNSVQSAETPAESTAILMADSSRQGQLIYSVRGKQVEIEESILLKAVQEKLLDKYGIDEEGDLLKFHEATPKSERKLN